MQNACQDVRPAWTPAWVKPCHQHNAKELQTHTILSSTFSHISMKKRSFSFSPEFPPSYGFSVHSLSLGESRYLKCIREFTKMPACVSSSVFSLVHHSDDHLLHSKLVKWPMQSPWRSYIDVLGKHWDAVAPHNKLDQLLPLLSAGCVSLSDLLDCDHIKKKHVLKVWIYCMNMCVYMFECVGTHMLCKYVWGGPKLTLNIFPRLSAICLLNLHLSQNLEFTNSG